MTSTRIQANVSTFVSVSLYVSDCAFCGAVFAMTTDLEARRRQDGRTFYCPNGHTMTFGDGEADKLRRRLKFTEEQLNGARQIAQSEKRRAAAAKGQLTKMRNRVARGLCPKPGCRRSFTSLHDHVRHEHPELLDEIQEITT